MPSATVRIHRWRPAAVLAVGGPDAFTFLQGQFSNDLRGASPGGAGVYGLWLDRKGHVLADSFIVRPANANGYVVCSYFSAAAEIRQTLENHLIADEVNIADETSGWIGTTLMDGGMEAPSDALRFEARRGVGGAIEILSREPLVVTGAVELDSEDMERLRIAAGVPRVPDDIGPGELPAEGGLDVDAISHTKGCYLGQEVVTRVRSLGRVRRQLERVAGPGPAPGRLQKLFHGDRVAGEIRSSVGFDDGRFQALALVTPAQAGEAAALSLSAGGAAGIRVVPTGARKT